MNFLITCLKHFNHFKSTVFLINCSVDYLSNSTLTLNNRLFKHPSASCVCAWVLLVFCHTICMSLCLSWIFTCIPNKEPEEHVFFWKKICEKQSIEYVAAKNRWKNTGNFLVSPSEEVWKQVFVILIVRLFFYGSNFRFVLDSEVNSQSCRAMCSF